MSTTSRRLPFLALFATLALTTSCKFTGGGWLFAPGGTGKATFSFSGQCDKRTGTVKGQGDYSDKAGKVQVHLVVTAMSSGQGQSTFCQPGTSEPGGTLSGTYTPQPKTAGPGGTFSLFVEDMGEPGPSAGDNIDLRLSGGVHDGYINFGTIQGGNVQSK